MFPEGTRRRKGLRKKYTAQAHSGAARIAIDAGVPLVPAGIKGTNGVRAARGLRVRYGGRRSRPRIDPVRDDRAADGGDPDLEASL